MRKLRLRFITALMSITFLIASFPAANAENEVGAKPGTKSVEALDVVSASFDYENYMAKNAQIAPYAGEPVELLGTALNGKPFSQEEYKGKTAALLYAETTAEYKINVPETAMYGIKMTYIVMAGNANGAEFEIKIDGQYPFLGCKNLAVNRMWANEGEPRVDAIGNEYASEQIAYDGYTTKSLYDNMGIVTSPYEFALTQGTHTITVKIITQGIAVHKIFAAPPDRAESYTDTYKTYDASKNYKGAPVMIEGENALIKSTRSVVAKSDNASPEVYPSSAIASKLNYIGGATWKSIGEEVVWHFEAPDSGYYKLGFSFKQSEVINGTSYRTLKIDGKVPFEEAAYIKFGYSSKWQFQALGEGEKPYLIWLDKGTHTMSMEVTFGEIASSYIALKDLIYDIGNLYLDIIMITGESPDANRDYDLFKQIPDFNENLKDFEKRLKTLSEDMKRFTGQKTNPYIAAYQNMSRVINAMYQNPYSAQTYLSDYYNQYAALGSTLSGMTQMPLAIDRIQLCSPEKDFEINKSAFIEKLWFGVQRFFASFSDDYSHLSAEGAVSEKSIKLWINWGRDQSMVLNSLIQETFTRNTGINVKLELTNASLVKGLLSNTQPDLALQLSRAEPVNLAMRGALHDLSTFDDYSEVIKRFGETAVIPYRYNGGVYALPDTQAFNLMFYRKDIFNQLNLKVPNTWAEFLDVASNIARNNMTVYLPYVQISTATTVNTGVGGLNLFPSILQQYGGSVYNEQGNSSALKEPTALSAFRFWTQMYTDYKIPTSQSFYNRFKVGTCPLGIEAYTMYTQFSEAALEIDGVWGIALVPGVEQADGSINRSVSGSGTGCFILEKSKNKKEAWEFLKWWTSAQTQTAFNNNVESILGTIARTTTATLEAFEQMSWDSEDLEILKAQRAQVAEIPELPGSYYLSRAVDQAFWQVIDGVYNPKDALYYWGEVANNEIKRKIEEYS